MAEQLLGPHGRPTAAGGGGASPAAPPPRSALAPSWSVPSFAQTPMTRPPAAAEAATQHGAPPAMTEALTRFANLAEAMERRVLAMEAPAAADAAPPPPADIAPPPPTAPERALDRMASAMSALERRLTAAAAARLSTPPGARAGGGGDGEGKYRAASAAAMRLYVGDARAARLHTLLIARRALALSGTLARWRTAAALALSMEGAQIDRRISMETGRLAAEAAARGAEQLTDTALAQQRQLVSELAEASLAVERAESARAVAEEGALVAQSALAAAEKAGADLYAEVSELRRSSKALSVTLGATRMNRALTRTVGMVLAGALLRWSRAASRRRRRKDLRVARHAIKDVETCKRRLALAHKHVAEKAISRASSIYDHLSLSRAVAVWSATTAHLARLRDAPAAAAAAARSGEAWRLAHSRTASSQTSLWWTGKDTGRRPRPSTTTVTTETGSSPPAGLDGSSPPANTGSTSSPLRERYLAERRRQASPSPAGPISTFFRSRLAPPPPPNSAQLNPISPFLAARPTTLTPPPGSVFDVRPITPNDGSPPPPPPTPSDAGCQTSPPSEVAAASEVRSPTAVPRQSAAAFLSTAPPPTEVPAERVASLIRLQQAIPNLGTAQLHALGTAAPLVALHARVHGSGDGAVSAWDATRLGGALHTWRLAAAKLTAVRSVEAASAAAWDAFTLTERGVVTADGARRGVVSRVASEAHVMRGALSQWAAAVAALVVSADSARLVERLSAAAAQREADAAAQVAATQAEAAAQLWAVQASSKEQLAAAQAAAREREEAAAANSARLAERLQAEKAAAVEKLEAEVRVASRKASSASEEAAAAAAAAATAEAAAREKAAREIGVAAEERAARKEALRRQLEAQAAAEAELASRRREAEVRLASVHPAKAAEKLLERRKSKAASIGLSRANSASELQAAAEAAAAKLAAAEKAAAEQKAADDAAAEAAAAEETAAVEKAARAAELQAKREANIRRRAEEKEAARREAEAAEEKALREFEEAKAAAKAEAKAKAERMAAEERRAAAEAEAEARRARIAREEEEEVARREQVQAQRRAEAEAAEEKVRELERRETERREQERREEAAAAALRLPDGWAEAVDDEGEVCCAPARSPARPPGHQPSRLLSLPQQATLNPAQVYYYNEDRCPPAPVLSSPQLERPDEDSSPHAG